MKREAQVEYIAEEIFHKQIQVGEDKRGVEGVDGKGQKSLLQLRNWFVKPRSVNRFHYERTKKKRGEENRV